MGALRVQCAQALLCLPLSVPCVASCACVCRRGGGGQWPHSHLHPLSITGRKAQLAAPCTLLHRPPLGGL